MDGKIYKPLLIRSSVNISEIIKILEDFRNQSMRYYVIKQQADEIDFELANASLKMYDLYTQGILNKDMAKEYKLFCQEACLKEKDLIKKKDSLKILHKNTQQELIKLNKMIDVILNKHNSNKYRNEYYNKKLIGNYSRKEFGSLTRLLFDSELPKVCELCGSTEKLNIHHSVYKYPILREHLQRLCVPCHIKTHNILNGLGKPPKKHLK